MYQQHMLLKVRKPNLKYACIMSISCVSIKHLNLQNSIKIAITIWQIIFIYITTTVLPAKSDSDTMFCFLSHQGFTFQDRINIQVIYSANHIYCRRPGPCRLLN